MLFDCTKNWQRMRVSAWIYLLSGVSGEDLVFHSGAVELVHQLPDLNHFVLYNEKTENTIQLSIVLLLQDRHVTVQLGQAFLQSQQQTLQLQCLQRHTWLHNTQHDCRHAGRHSGITFCGVMWVLQSVALPSAVWSLSWGKAFSVGFSSHLQLLLGAA